MDQASSERAAAHAIPRQGSVRPRRIEGPGPRTSTACRMCRDKKVKCSGTRPCDFCVKRGLECVFSQVPKRRLYSVTHIRDLEEKVAQYEKNHGGFVRAISERPASAHCRSGPTALTTPSPPESRVEATGQGHDGGPAQRSVQTPENAPDSGDQFTTPTPQTKATPQAIAPVTSLSSSETFSSELRTLLSERSRPDPGPTSVAHVNATPSSTSQRRGGFENIKCWPTEEDAHSMLNIVVLNVGVSQHLFDVRTFLDNLSALFDEDMDDSEVPDLWYAECLLIFAIGRLLQARWDDNSKLPGDDFFNDALRRFPDLGGLREQGLLGIELMGLSALYLQIVDRKEDAYLYVSVYFITIVALSVLNLSCEGKHSSPLSDRPWPSQGPTDPELQTLRVRAPKPALVVNLYAGTAGFPMAISDAAITALQPSDQIGYTSAASIAVNVKLAQITGRITATIYSQNSESEVAFIKEVQDILHALHSIENDMPVEIAGGSHPAELLLNEVPLSSPQLSSARTISSLHLTVYQVPTASG
ncbi:transcriptional regulatory protein [Paramyrothecium foliicola]|nr:transcriptional regulatory protein [Paramyrothecium foliicola]